MSVAPNQRVTIDPPTIPDSGAHCHNAYHLASGMATILSYLH